MDTDCNSGGGDIDTGAYLQRMIEDLLADEDTDPDKDYTLELEWIADIPGVAIGDVISDDKVSIEEMEGQMSTAATITTGGETVMDTDPHDGS